MQIFILAALYGRSLLHVALLEARLVRQSSLEVDQSTLEVLLLLVQAPKVVISEAHQTVLQVIEIANPRLFFLGKLDITQVPNRGSSGLKLGTLAIDLNQIHLSLQQQAFGC